MTKYPMTRTIAPVSTALNSLAWFMLSMAARLATAVLAERPRRRFEPRVEVPTMCPSFVRIGLPIAPIWHPLALPLIAAPIEPAALVLTARQLQRMAARCGVTGAGRMRKAELLEVLK